MNALLLILHGIPISTPPSMECNCAVVAFPTCLQISKFVVHQFKFFLHELALPLVQRSNNDEMVPRQAGSTKTLLIILTYKVLSDL